MFRHTKRLQFGAKPEKPDGLYARSHTDPSGRSMTATPVQTATTVVAVAFLAVESLASSPATGPATTR